MLKELESLLDLECDNTRRAYESVVRLWLDFWGREGEPWKGAKTRDIALFLVFLKNRGNCPNTIKHRFSLLNTIFDGLVSLELLEKNPARALHKAVFSKRGRPTRASKLVNYDSIRATIEAMPVTTNKQLRDRAAMAVLFGCGLRRSELINLNLNDVGVTPAGEIFLKLRNTKNGETREQPVPSWTWEFLNDLVLMRQREGAADKDPLFINRYGGTRRWSAVTLYRHFKKIFGCNPHSARATAASYLLSRGESVVDVARFLGHKSLMQVIKYDKRRLNLEDNPGYKVDFKS